MATAIRCLSPEHPINPPITDDPFQCDMPGDAGFLVRPVQGVMHVYRDEEALLNEEPQEWPYPNLAEFLHDQNIMYALMTDGPM